MSTPRPYPIALTEAASHASAAATRVWQQTATTSNLLARTVSVTRIAWNTAYPVAYRHGYLTLGSQAATEFSELQQRLTVADTRQGDAVGNLARLARRIQPQPTPPPPLSRRVMTVAATAARDRPDGITVPEAVTAAVHHEAANEGGIHGALTAAADLAIGWQQHADSAVRAMASAGMTLEEHVNATLAGLNQDVISNWVGQEHRPAPTAVSLAAASFAEPVTSRNTAPVSPHPPAPVVSVAARRRSRP